MLTAVHHVPGAVPFARLFEIFRCKSLKYSAKWASGSDVFCTRLRDLISLGLEELAFFTVHTARLLYDIEVILEDFEIWNDRAATAIFNASYHIETEDEDEIPNS